MHGVKPQFLCPNDRVHLRTPMVNFIQLRRSRTMTKASPVDQACNPIATDASPSASGGQEMRFVDCCPCHGADESGARPAPEIRRYVVPPVQAEQAKALARRMTFEDAQWVLLREGLAKTRPPRRLQA